MPKKATDKWDKQALIVELQASLATELAAAVLAHKTTKDAATHEEAKPENDKDTRALEQSYLARGQAQRVLDLQGAVADVSAMIVRKFGDEMPVAIGALVTLEDDDEATASYFVAPAGGGTKLANGVVVVTPKAPLGGALVGRRVGDEVTITLAGRVRSWTIVSVL